MKKLALALTLSAVSAAAVANSVNTEVSGYIQDKCEVSVVDPTALSFGSDLNENNVRTAQITLECNVNSGAELAIQSDEGHLEASNMAGDDDGLRYEATINTSSISSSIGDLVLTSDMNNYGTNGLTESITIPNNAGQILNVQTLDLSIQLLETGKWAGGYKDTIRLELSAIPAPSAP